MSMPGLRGRLISCRTASKCGAAGAKAFDSGLGQSDGVNVDHTGAVRKGGIAVAQPYAHLLYGTGVRAGCRKV